MSVSAEARKIFADKFDSEMRAVFWGQAQQVIQDPTFTEDERRYARQLAGLLDAIDLGDPTSFLFTASALRWTLALLLTNFEVGNEREKTGS